MRILVATGLYPPDIGGPATHTVMMETCLPKYDFDVVVLPFSEVRKLPKVFRHTAYFFKCIARGRDADIIFAQDAGSVGFPAMCAAKILRKKFVIRMSGDYAWEQSVQRFGVTDTIDEFQTKRYGLRAELFRWVRTFVSLHADRIIAPSNYFKHLVEGWGIEETIVYTVYNGINLDINPVYPTDVPEGNLIVSAGRLVSWKGFPLLIELLTRLPESWRLVIIGEGLEEQNLKQHAAAKGVSARVHFVGRCSREEVFGWCKEATVFALNTSFESFSFQIVEAMASGVPVVATHIGSIPELITSGIEGVLLEPDDFDGFLDVIKNVPTTREVWDERTKRALIKSKTFSVELTVKKLSDVLGKI